MTNQDLFKQLNRLKNIKPDAGYSNVSKLIITTSHESEIANELKASVSALRAISPSPEFLAMSKPAVLSHPRTLAEKVTRVLLPNIGKRAMSYGLSVGVAAMLLAIVMSGANNLTPEVDVELASAAETSIKDIDIRLEEAGYFVSSADITRMALNDAANASGPAVASPSAENEFNGLRHDNPLNPNINDMLKNATL